MTRRVRRREGRISRRRFSPEKSFAQTADVRSWSKEAIVGAEADRREGDAHRIVPVECLGGVTSQSR